MNTENSDQMEQCPCCLERTISDPGTYEICEVCGWEDDPSQASNPELAGGANNLSLVQARQQWLAMKNNKK